MSWLPGANPAKVMSSIIRRRNGVIVISLRSKIGRGPPTQPREEILSTVQISDAALTLGEAVSPIQGISSILASVVRIFGRNAHNNQLLTSKFPTERNRELIGQYQGTKSAYQGSFLSDQGRVPWLGFLPGAGASSLNVAHVHALLARRSATAMEIVL